MLEHLLLLPRNAPLFAERRLHTVVLDEIHTYAGAQAIEVAYLLRKLRNKLRLAHPVQCIGTSASLGEGADAEAKTKRFASDLFGADVAEVVRGRRQTHRSFRELPATFELIPSAWAGLKEACQAFQDEVAEDAGDAGRRALWAEVTEGIARLPPLPQVAGRTAPQCWSCSLPTPRCGGRLQRSTGKCYGSRIWRRRCLARYPRRTRRLPD